MKLVRVENGIDRLACGAEIRLDAELCDARIGLLTNASGVDKSARPTYDIIADRYRLSVLFAPEHGIRTNLQDGAWGAEERDPETGARLVSLRHEGGEAAETALSDIDVLIYDIQDVGARFYTYLYNLSAMMRKCAGKNIPVVVLDRINPIGGAVEGRLLDSVGYFSGIGEYSIPTRYGMTVGEFASYINAEEKIGCKLTVVPVQGWERGLFADETDLLWVNPSPNIPSVTSAINYIGTCIFEATDISEGRGTVSPFNLVGAPFIDSAELTARMNRYRLDGVVFRRAYFTPQFNKFAGELCQGVELHITDRASYSPFRTMLYLFREVRGCRGFTQKDRSLCLRYGTDALCGDYDPESEYAAAARENDEYLSKMKKYLLY